MSLLPPAITLPSPLQRRVEAVAASLMYPQSVTVDFSQPAGEPALTAPDSVSWMVFKNPLSMFVGGVAAVILELAEPRVRTGVWEHTAFRRNPLARLQRTGLAAMLTVYGPRSQAEAMIAGVARMHGRVRGTTPCGQPYRADDPELLDWVHATASFGFLEAYHVYVRPLGQAQRESYYAEGKLSARLYGALGTPASPRDLDRLFDGMRDKLEASPIVSEFLDIMRGIPLLPRPFAPIQGMLVTAALEIVPEWVRQRLQLQGQELRPWQRQVVARAGAAADRLLLRSTPPVQACRRLGLPDDYLYTGAG